MKIRFNLPRPRHVRSFAEKFGRDTAFFGSIKRAEPQRYEGLPWLLGCAAVAIALCVTILFLGRLWKVEEVTATDGRYYTAAVLLRYAEVEEGDELLGFNASAVEKRLKQALPLIDTVNVHKHLSGKVSIEIAEQEKLYYTRHNVNYYIIAAESRKVLCVSAAPTEAQRVGAVYIGLPESARVRVGDKLSFVNLPYAPESTPGEVVTYEVETAEPDKEYAYVFEFAEALMASPLAPRVVGMDVSDRYDITFILDGRIRVRVGDMSELSRKLLMVERSLEDKTETLPPDLATLVDVSDPARIVHRTSPDIELPSWAE